MASVSFSTERRETFLSVFPGDGPRFPRAWSGRRGIIRHRILTYLRDEMVIVAQEGLDDFPAGVVGIGQKNRRDDRWAARSPGTPIFIEEGARVPVGANHSFVDFGWPRGPAKALCSASTSSATL